MTQDINRVIEHSITNYAYFSMFNFIQINFQNFLGSTVIVSPSIQQKISDELMMQIGRLGFTPALFYLSLKTKNFNCVINAANHGHPISTFQLGLISDNQGNTSKALENYFKASRLGQIWAMNNIAVYYYEGAECSYNLKMAKHYFKRASYLGDPIAMYNLGYIYYEEYHKIEKNFKCSHGSKIEKAIKFFQRSLDFGFSRSGVFLGNIYVTGDGVDIDFVKGVYYFKSAANLNDSNAYYCLGKLYQYGQGVTIDTQLSKLYFENAVSLGSKNALHSLGVIYLECKDFQMAKMYFEKAVQYKNSFSMNSLGQMYVNGTGVPKDFQKAKQYFQSAANLKNSYGYFNLALFYCKAEKNINKAIEYCKKAYCLGNQEIFKILRVIVSLEKINLDDLINFFECKASKDDFNANWFLELLNQRKSFSSI